MKSNAIDRLRNIPHCVNCLHCKMRASKMTFCQHGLWAHALLSIDNLTNNLIFAEKAYNCKYYESMED